MRFQALPLRTYYQNHHPKISPQEFYKGLDIGPKVIIVSYLLTAATAV
jgi:hypothetical protein